MTAWRHNWLGAVTKHNGACLGPIHDREREPFLGSRELNGSRIHESPVHLLHPMCLQFRNKILWGRAEFRTMDDPPFWLDRSCHP